MRPRAAWRDRRGDDVVHRTEGGVCRRFDAHERGVERLVDRLAISEQRAAQSDENEDGAGEKADPAMEAQEESAQGRASPPALTQPNI